MVESPSEFDGPSHSESAHVRGTRPVHCDSLLPRGQLQVVLPHHQHPSVMGPLVGGQMENHS